MTRMTSFFLKLRSDHIEKVDEIFRSLIVHEEFDAALDMHMVLKTEEIGVYKVKMPAKCLLAFKRKLEELCCLKSFELFEYKEW